MTLAAVLRTILETLDLCFPNQTLLDSSFRNFYKIQAPPVMHGLGEPVFVEVFVLKHEDKDLELVLNDCWATPSPDPHDELRWTLLHRGYINQLLC